MWYTDEKRTESRKCLFRYNHSAYVGTRSHVRKGKAGVDIENKIGDILGNFLPSKSFLILYELNEKWPWECARVYHWILIDKII